MAKATAEVWTSLDNNTVLLRQGIEDKTEGYRHGNFAFFKNWSMLNPNPLVPEDIITANPTVSQQRTEPAAL